MRAILLILPRTYFSCGIRMEITEDLLLQWRQMYLFTYMHFDSCYCHCWIWYSVWCSVLGPFLAIMFSWSKNMRSTALLTGILIELRPKIDWMLVHIRQRYRAIVHDICDDLCILNPEKMEKKWKNHYKNYVHWSQWEW